MENKPEINEYGYLVCPRCERETDNLHQIEAMVIFRENEDGHGNAVIVDSQEIIISIKENKDIEWRRNVLYIKFSCELCQKISTLKIQQHKGNTIVKWGEKP